MILYKSLKNASKKQHIETLGVKRRFSTSKSTFLCQQINVTLREAKKGKTSKIGALAKSFTKVQKNK